jgi:DNA-binding NtrC family response regulator
MNNESADLKNVSILLVDDQPANLDVLCELLESAGYRISVATGGATALEIAVRAVPDLILLDVLMPGLDGYEVCRQLKQEAATQDIPVIFITARDLKEDILAGFRAGGVDYIVKPFRDEEVLARVQTHVRLNRLTQEVIQKNQALEEEMAQRQALKGQLSALSERENENWGLEDFVGHSPTIQRIFKDIRLLQENVAPSVLIAGESGTGKELIARAIHFGSGRRAGPFVPVNCAALPNELVESLLFGHVKGAFTGADQDRIGYFEMAHEGTLFLDEIGEMPQELQAKLLRVLEDGEVRRIGAAAGKKVDVRVLAATNIDMQQKIQTGAFRQDLYYRLARFTVKAPPLRQRQEDIPLLAQHFVQLFAAEMGRESPALSSEVVQMLSVYGFPGNVRELKNTIERALIESGGEEIHPYHLHFLSETMEEQAEPGVATGSLPDLPLDLNQAELWVIKRAIAKSNGNIAAAARLLCTHRNRIYRALAQEEHGE